MTQAGFAHRPAFFAYHGLWRVLDYIYPPKCVSCGKPGCQWCSDCQAKMSLIAGIICERCGEPQPNPGLCPRCRNNPPRYRYLRSVAVFEGELRDAIHSLKYHRNMSMGDTLGSILTQYLTKLNWRYDFIVSVPLGTTRMRERGYNQASLLALPVALALGLPFKPGAICRLKETNTQVNLSASDRLRNVMGAFAANSNLVQDKSILIIDDVATTGSTMIACTEALLQGGAKDIFGLTLARAVNRRI